MQLIAILQLGWPQTLLCSYRQLYLVRMKHENIVAKTTIAKSPHTWFLLSLSKDDDAFRFVRLGSIYNFSECENQCPSLFVIDIT